MLQHFLIQSLSRFSVGFRVVVNKYIVRQATSTEFYSQILESFQLNIYIVYHNKNFWPKNPRIKHNFFKRHYCGSGSTKKTFDFSSDPKMLLLWVLFSYEFYSMYPFWILFALWIRTRNRERTNTKIRQYCSYLFLVSTGLVQLY